MTRRDRPRSLRAAVGVLTLGAAAALLAAPAALQAQTLGARERPFAKRAAATIVGTVGAELPTLLPGGATGEPTVVPITDAELTIPGTPLATRTDADGRSRVDDLPEGRWLVRVRRLGFEPLVFGLTIAGGENRALDLRMTPLPQRLSAVEVRERSGLAGFAADRARDYAERRRLVSLDATTRQEIADRFRGDSTATLGDVLHDMAFVSLVAFDPLHPDRFGGAGLVSGAGATNAVTRAGLNRLMARSSALAGGASYAPCQRVFVSLDGGQPIDAWQVSRLPADRIELVELYRPRGQSPIDITAANVPQPGCVAFVWIG